MQMQLMQLYESLDLLSKNDFHLCSLFNLMEILGQTMSELETLTNEYKEFCLKNNIYNYYERREVEQMLITGKINHGFNRVLYDNIRIYMNTYIPKYASAFSNSQGEFGMLHIGISDFGEITGIPIYGEIDTQKINKLFEDSMKYIRGCPTSESGQIYKDKITYEIIKLAIDTDYLYDRSDKIATKYRDLKAEYIARYKKYLEDRDRWMIGLRRCACKLNDVIKYNRDDIVTFIKIHTDSNASKIIIKRLDENPIIDNIEDRKNDKNDFIYWLFLYKDEYVDKYLPTKPKPPVIPKIYNAPFNLLTHLTEMRWKFVKINPAINYYLIRVKFPCNLHRNKSLEFRNLRRNRWEKRARILLPSGPSCI